MSRLRTLALVLLAALVIGAGTMFAYAQGIPGGPDRGGRSGGSAMVPLRGLNLTDVQKDQVRDIQQRHRDERQAARQQLSKAIDTQRKAIEAVPLNEGLITSTSGELAQAQTQVALAEARLRSEIIAVLTPEQQAQLTKMRAERQSGDRGPRRERGPRSR